MAETNPSEPSLPESDLPPSPPPGDAPATPPVEEKKKARKRRWPKVVLGVVVLLVLLIVLAPTIASTGPVRSMILRTINDTVEGKVEIADWSIGWNSGISADGLKLYDPEGKLVAQAAHVKTQLSLIKALRSGFDDLALGRTDIDKLDLTDVRVDEEGTPNVARAVRLRKKRTRPASTMKLSGDIHVNDLTGNVTAFAADGATQRLHINPSNLAVVMTGLNETIKNDFQLSFTVEDPSKPGAAAGEGKITLAGELDLFENDRLSVKKLKVKQQLTLAKVDLAAVNAFLAMADVDVTLAGVANGTLDVNVQGLNNVGANGLINVAGFVATGDALQGGRFASDLSIPVKVTSVTDSAGGKILKVDELRVVTDYGEVAVTVDASQASLSRLADRLPPGREGRVTVAVNFDKKIPQLVEGLRAVLQLRPDVKVESGHLYAQAETWLFADRVVQKTQFSLADVAATSKGGRITLSPISGTVDATYAPAAAGGAVAMGQLTDVGISLDSAFARLSGSGGKGGSLGQFNLTGEGDFSKLHDQLKQFADVGKLDLKGTWTLRASTNGDLAKAGSPIAATLALAAKDLRVSGLGDLPAIVEPWLELSASGNVFLEDNAPRAIKGAVVKLRSNNPEQPTVDVALSGDVDLKTYASSAFDVTVRAALAKARDEFGAIPQLASLNYFEGGTLSLSAAGSYDGTALKINGDRPLAIKIAGLAIRQAAQAGSAVVLKDQSLDATFAGLVRVSADEVGIEAAALSVVSPGMLEVRKNGGDLRATLFKASKKVTGSGGVVLFADLKRLGDLSKAFGPPATGTALAATATPAAGELTKGLLNGSLTFTRGDRPVTHVAGSFTADVAVTTNKEPLADNIAITLTADAPDDLTQELKADLHVNGAFVKASVSDAQLYLARQLADKTTTAFNGPLDLVKSAKLSVRVDRLEAVQPMLASFSSPTPEVPPPAAPVAVAKAVAPAGKKKVTGEERISAPAAEDEPAAAAAAAKPAGDLRVLSGKLALDANVTRDGRTMLLNDATLDLSDLAFQRGDGRYDAKGKPIQAKFTMAVNTADAARPEDAGPVERVEVRSLAAALDAGELKMTRPIVATNLSAPSPTVDGAVEMSGSLAALLRLVEALQGVKANSAYPYAGDYALAQDVKTGPDAIRLIGTLVVKKLRAFDPAAPAKETFAEDEMSISNDVAVDMKGTAATLNKLDVAMRSSNALGLKIAGGKLADWARRRTIAAPIRVDLHADWAKVWALAKPLLDPETLESLADLEISGVMDRSFVLEGAYPAVGVDKRGHEVALSTAQSLKFLTLSGGVSFDRLAYSGVELKNVDLPVAMDKGIVTIHDKTRPAGQDRPKPFFCNEGEMDLGGVQIDVRHASAVDGSVVPWFTIPDKGKVVMRNVAMNPLLADSTVGNYVNPGFSGAQDARGRVTLISQECRDVPLDWFTASKRPGKAPPRKGRKQTVSDGRAVLELHITEMQLKAPLLGELLNVGMVKGEVKKGVITAEKGMVDSDIPIVSGNAELMRWTGKVSLQDRRIINFNTAIAKELLAEVPFIRNNQKLLPAIVNVPVSGAFDSPKIDLKGAVLSYVPGLGGIKSGKPEDLIKGAGDILGGLKKDKKDKGGGPRGGDDAPEPGTDARDLKGDAKPKADPVGGLIDIAGGLLDKKDKKKDSKALSGDERISSDPKAPAGGDERISSDPNAPKPAATTKPAKKRRGGE